MKSMNTRKIIEENVDLSEFEKVRGNVEYDGSALAVTGEDTHSVALWEIPDFDFEAEISSAVS
ncbi:MAG: hypothetical protein ACLRSW_08740 [Christensenellaceae bacterium]